MTCCSKCGQRLPIKRHGIALPPIKLRIFDLIKARPGITVAELSSIVYDTSAKGEIIRVHIAQMRELFMDEPVTIRGIPHYGYRVIGA